MRLTALVAISVAVFGWSVAAAQGERADRAGAEDVAPQDSSDEVIVTGKRLAKLRLEVQTARERAYDVFNEINSDNDFDVHCHNETRVFSHVKRRTCRAQFETRISNGAGKEYLDGLLLSCRGPEGVTQACMFSGVAERGVSRAQAVESPLQGKSQQLNQEIMRLANEDARFAQAILDFYTVSQKYDAARKRRDE
jgi:hypothetical protein